MINKKGFDSILVDVNSKISSKLAKRFFVERGNPKVAWDAGINAAPVKAALDHGIKYIFYAEHGESEYGGLKLSEESIKRRDLREVIEHQIGDFPENWVNDEISLKDLSPYIYPDEDQLKNVEIFILVIFLDGACWTIGIMLKKNCLSLKQNQLEERRERLLILIVSMIK